MLLYYVGVVLFDSLPCELNILTLNPEQSIRENNSWVRRQCLYTSIQSKYKMSVFLCRLELNIRLEMFPIFYIVPQQGTLTRDIHVTKRSEVFSQ